MAYGDNPGRHRSVPQRSKPKPPPMSRAAARRPAFSPHPPKPQAHTSPRQIALSQENQYASQGRQVQHAAQRANRKQARAPAVHGGLGLGGLRPRHVKTHDIQAMQRRILAKQQERDYANQGLGIERNAAQQRQTAQYRQAHAHLGLASILPPLKLLGHIPGIGGVAKDVGNIRLPFSALDVMQATDKAGSAGGKALVKGLVPWLGTASDTAAGKWISKESGRAGSDLLNFGVQAVPSLYQLGAAAYEAGPKGPLGGSDLSRLKKIGKGFADNTAIGQTVQHGPKAGLKQAEAHPLYTALGAAGVYGTLGRVAGMGVRGATVGRVGARDREALNLTGGQKIERQYSPNLFTATVQKAAAKRASAKAQSLYDAADHLKAQEMAHRALGETERAHTVHGQYVEKLRAAMKADPNQATGAFLRHDQSRRLAHISGGEEITRRHNAGMIDQILTRAEPRKSPRKMLGGIPAHLMDSPIVGEIAQVALREHGDETFAQVHADLTKRLAQLDGEIAARGHTLEPQDYQKAIDYRAALSDALHDPKLEKRLPQLVRFARVARSLAEHQEAEKVALGNVGDARVNAKWVPWGQVHRDLRHLDEPVVMETAAGKAYRESMERFESKSKELRDSNTELAKAQGRLQGSRLPPRQLAAHEKKLAGLQTELGSIAAKSSDVGISEFRNGATQGRMKELHKDVRALADQHGVEVTRVSKAEGRFVEEAHGPQTESSFIVHVKGPTARVDAYAAELAAKYGQDSAGIFEHDSSGPHASITLHDVKDFDAAYKAADDLGLYYSSRLGKNLSVWADNEADVNKVQQLAEQLDVKATQRSGHVRFKNAEDRSAASAGAVPANARGARLPEGRRAHHLLSQEAKRAQVLKGRITEAHTALKRAEREQQRRVDRIAEAEHVATDAKVYRDQLREDLKAAVDQARALQVPRSARTYTREFEANIGGERRPVSLAEVAAEGTRAGYRPAFLTHKETGNSAFFKPAITRPGEGPKSRSGESYRMGLVDSSGGAVRASLRGSQSTIDAIKTFDHTIKDMGLGVFQPHETAAIDRAIRSANENFPELGPFTSVRVAPFIEKADIVSKINDAMLDAGYDQRVGGLISEMIGDAQKPGAGPVAVVPEHLMASWRQLAEGPWAKNNVVRYMRWFAQNFRWTVLPFSTKWLTGNTAEATIRSAFSGHGLVDLYTGVKGIKQMGRDVAEGRLSRDEYNRMMSLSVGGRHFGSALDQFISHGGERNAQTVPGLRYFVRSLRATQHHILGFNGHIEDIFNAAGLGQVMARDAKALARDLGRFNHRAADIMEEALRRRAVDTNKALELKTYLDRALGRYSGHSPGERWVISNFTPFWDWYRNALFFVLWSLPHDHPQVAGLIASTEQAMQGDLQKQGAEWGSSVPSYLRGAVVDSKGNRRRLDYYTPFGAFADPAGSAADLVLPQYNGILMGLAGRDWKMDPLNGDHGGEATVLQRLLYAGNSTLESQLPGVRQGRTVMEHGGSASPYSTIFKPQIRPGTAKGGALAGLNRLVNPAYAIPPGNKEPAGPVKPVRRRKGLPLAPAAGGASGRLPLAP